MNCLGCDKEGLFLCPDCQDKLKRLDHQQCIVCRSASVSGITHPPCRKADAPDGLISVFDYRDDLISQSIIWGKYKFLPDVYRLLGSLVTDYLVENNYHNIVNNFTVCPIPLSKSRLRWRGFNQSEIIADSILKYFSYPSAPAIKRIKNTKTQKDLTKAERLENMASSFAVSDVQALQNKNVILIDDVVTTGATLLEATKLLKSAGAGQVWCLTLARD